MVFRKVCKAIYSEPIKKDEVREMLIASANYPYSLVSEEDNFTGYSFAKITSPSGTMKRKRRLDNLTPDEKLLRKKLKNREAAQTSRDKKKAYITSLETAVKQLRDQMDWPHGLPMLLECTVIPRISRRNLFRFNAKIYE